MVGTSCSETKADEVGSQYQTIKSIYWSDGDSGRLTLPNDTVIKFRLDDWDAPETGGVGAAIGGAQCEQERELGFQTKEFMVLNSQTGTTFSHSEEYDRYDRLLIRIYNYEGELAIRAENEGLLKSWKHDAGKQLEKRPLWCVNN